MMKKQATGVCRFNLTTVFFRKSFLNQTQMSMCLFLFCNTICFWLFSFFLQVLLLFGFTSTHRRPQFSTLISFWPLLFSTTFWCHLIWSIGIAVATTTAITSAHLCVHSTKQQQQQQQLSESCHYYSVHSSVKKLTLFYPSAVAAAAGPFLPFCQSSNVEEKK